jgi:formylglycine-generating enzyme required for sulfatase activity
MKNISMFSTFLVMIGALFVAGCGDDTEMTNSQPTIDRVIVPEQIKAGEEVKLEVVAHDADGDKLTYKWKVSEGTVNAAGVWTVPREPMNAAVLVHVSDGVNSSVASSKISVEILPPSEPLAPKGMVAIPAGEFQMGNNSEWAANNEQPVHTVYLDAFFMDEHEVANFEYQLFVRANPSWQKDKCRRVSDGE